MISLMIRMMVFGAPLPAIRWMIRILTVIATRMISVKYAVRNGITLKAPRPAAISMMRPMPQVMMIAESDCFHKNAPSGYKITENLS
mgnify:CR=1 FL=1